MACVVMLTSAVSYAETAEPQTYTVYDDDGNEYVLNEGEVLGVIRDKYGNIKEQHTISPCATYIDGEKITLAPGDTFTTYQYKVTSGFAVGFYTYYKTYYKNAATPATTPGGSVCITICHRETVGGSYLSVKGNNFSTTDDASSQEDPCNDNTRFKGLETGLVSSRRPYYNAVFENICNKTLTLCIFLSKD